MKKTFAKKIKSNQLSFSKNMLTALPVVLLSVLFSLPVNAQQVIESAALVNESNTGTNKVILILLFCTIALLLITILLFVQTRKLIMQAGNDLGYSNARPFIDKFNASVAIDSEADILMDHDYDGIKELDNNLPPWWKYGFYLTIIIAICYITYFNFLGGKMQIAEYETSVADAKIAQEAYQKEHGDMINEDNVKLIVDKAQLADAEKIFKTTCSPCHGMDGQGIVGPNLTDDYWIHGGSIKNIFHTITNGWPEKGMKSWKTDFSSLQINQLASYVKSLRGTNPPNPKEKQGDLYVEEGAGNTTTTSSKENGNPTPKDSVKAEVK